MANAVAKMRFRKNLSLLAIVGTVVYLFLLWAGQWTVIYFSSAPDRFASPEGVALPQVTTLSPKNESSLLGIASESDGLDRFHSHRFRKALQSFRNPINSYGNGRMLQFRPMPKDNRPPFHSVVGEDGNITGSVCDLLHFAIIGFGKCGTTSVMNWLDAHPELQIYPMEIYDLMHEKPADLIRKLYSLPVGHFYRGYKSPADAALPHTMDYFRTLFPKTKLLVGVRHPVKWFEGEFALFLRAMGKTLSTNNERNPLTGEYQLTAVEKIMFRAARVGSVPNTQNAIPNPVFLFEINQLSDDDESRLQRFREDVASFLELKTPLPPMLHRKPGRMWEPTALQGAKNDLKINICDSEHVPVRTELMRISRTSSLWLQRYFLDLRTMNATGIYVSSRDHLMDLLQGWMHDPCGDSETSKGGRFIVKAFQDEYREKSKRISTLDLVA